MLNSWDNKILDAKMFSTSEKTLINIKKMF